LAGRVLAIDEAVAVIVDAVATILNCSRVDARI